MTNLVPLQDYVVVKAVEAETTTASGIVIPDTASKEKPQKGEVVAVGPGKIKDDGSRAPMDVKAGDIVMFKKYAPDELEVDGGKVLVLSEADIIAKLS